MFYERRVRTFAGLRKETRHLDSDSGIRVAGSYEGKRCFAFVTRFAGAYTVMVYERTGRGVPSVGSRVLSREFQSPDDLEDFLAAITQRRVDAYVY